MKSYLCRNSQNDTLNKQSKKNTNLTSNEYINQKRNEESNYFANGNSNEYNSNNAPTEDLKYINENITSNKNKIEELSKKLMELKKEAKQKKLDIIDLLSNKESIEEIYKNQLYSLLNNKSGNINFNGNNNNGELNNLVASNIISENSLIHLNLNINNFSLLENETTNEDEDNLKISINEIKESDKNKYIEQIKNMFEDIFKKMDDNIDKSIKSIVNSSYESLDKINQDNQSDSAINAFFDKISLYIGNYSLGSFQDNKISLLLKYLLKINIINIKIDYYLKFVNKKYKETKKELKDKISFLEKKNSFLNEKKSRLEKKNKNTEELTANIFDKNTIRDIEKDSSNNNPHIEDIVNQMEKSPERDKHVIATEVKNLKDIVSNNNSDEKNFANDDKENKYMTRISKILDSKEEIRNIFGVNKYKPNNSIFNKSRLGANDGQNFKRINSSNKIDKTIRIGSKVNHSFISIIRITKTYSHKKKDSKDDIKKNSSILNDENSARISLQNYKRMVIPKNIFTNVNNKYQSNSKLINKIVESNKKVEKNEKSEKNENEKNEKNDYPLLTFIKKKIPTRNRKPSDCKGNLTMENNSHYSEIFKIQKMKIIVNNALKRNLNDKNYNLNNTEIYNNNNLKETNKSFIMSSYNAKTNMNPNFKQKKERDNPFSGVNNFGSKITPLNVYNKFRRIPLCTNKIKK